MPGPGESELLLLTSVATAERRNRTRNSGYIGLWLVNNFLVGAALSMNS